MTTLGEALALAFQCHQAGDWPRAERIYLQILEAAPRHADVLHLLGVLAYQQERHTAALDYLRRAITLDDRQPHYHNNLGNVWKALGRLDESRASYERALQLQPDDAGAYANLGNVWRERGRFAEARTCYEQVLRLRPQDAGACNNLGNVCYDQGQKEEALSWYRQALQRDPTHAEALNSLGNVYRELGRLDQALLCFQRGVQAHPHNPETQTNLGNVYYLQRKIEEAKACFQRALQLQPLEPVAHVNLGNCWYDQGELEPALACYQRALQLQPDNALAHNNLGNVLRSQYKLEEAKACYRRALALAPDYAGAYCNLGIAWKEQGKLAEARDCYAKALELDPEHVAAHSNLGVVWRDEDNLEAAEALCRRALELDPNHAPSHLNLGSVLHDRGKLEDAEAACRRALALKPNFAEAHYNLGVLRLLRGDFEAGWREYEGRFGFGPRVPEPALPRWDGSELKGRTILVTREQGLGDALHFVRYVSLLKQRGATVVFVCPPPLRALLSGCAGIDHLIDQLPSPVTCDCFVPLISLPRLVGTTLETIPADVPYLFPNSERLEHWQRVLSDLTGFNVGICWQGNPGNRNDRRRSVPLQQFEPLARVPGVHLVSLQVGVGVEQLEAVTGRWPITDLGSRFDIASFADAAAVLLGLDLLVSVDTALVHLAGALGAPTWLALPFVPDMRWLLGRNDSPWYPTIRLFRQERAGDWTSVFKRMAAALGARCRERTAVGRRENAS
jgi:tetratricopeptide (TPR) repeat protein